MPQRTPIFPSQSQSARRQGRRQHQYAPRCRPQPNGCRCHLWWSRHHKTPFRFRRHRTIRTRTPTGQPRPMAQRFLPGPPRFSTRTRHSHSRYGGPIRGGRALQNNRCAQNRLRERRPASSTSATPIHRRGCSPSRNRPTHSAPLMCRLKRRKFSRGPRLAAPLAVRSWALRHEDRRCITIRRTGGPQRRCKPPSRRRSSDWEARWTSFSATGL